jgi:RNA polymerase sigma-70 factor (ECF subfamily)
MQEYHASPPSLVGPAKLIGDIVRDGHSASAATSLLVRSEVSADEIAALTPDLLATAKYLLHNDAEARDLVQTTLEIGLRRRGQVRDPKRLLAWLLAIETREAFRVGRRIARLLSFEAHIQEIQTDGTALEAVSIRDAIGRLPPRIRTAVVLHHLVGLKVEETAAVMKVRENTVKTQLRIGLSRLREDLR